VQGFWDLYDPRRYLDRVFRHYMQLRHGKFPKKPRSARKRLDRSNLRAVLTIIWRQGIVRESRGVFWTNLFKMVRLNRGGIPSYIGTCAQAEHFLDYRERVRDQIEAQLQRYLADEAQKAQRGAVLEKPSVWHEPAMLKSETPGRVRLPQLQN
jgi:hypothetical protein